MERGVQAVCDRVVSHAEGERWEVIAAEELIQTLVVGHVPLRDDRVWKQAESILILVLMQEGNLLVLVNTWMTEEHSSGMTQRLMVWEMAHFWRMMALSRSVLHF